MEKETAKETVSKNFIEQIIEKIWQKESTMKFVPDFHLSQTDICILVMQNQFY